MKFKTTAKAIRKGYPTIISLGYCAARHLLARRSPVAYAAGIYGLNFDVYDIGDIAPGTAICTGYRGMPSGIKVDYAIISDGNKRAMNGNCEEILREVVVKIISLKGPFKGARR